ncbi:MAG: histidine phosphatase family protein [Nocardioides sp.]
MTHHPRRLVLLRHGQTAWNLEGRAQGHTDVGLDPTGHAQAAAVAPYLAGYAAVALWSSDLLRARQTASYVAEATGLDAQTDPRLREFDVGQRAGLTVAEFASRYPEAHARWASGHLTGGVPGAETNEQVQARMVPALRERLAALAPGETAIVVAHGACINVALLGVLGLPADTEGLLTGMENCGWATLAEHRSGSLRLASYNETVHTGLLPPEGTPDFTSDSPSG